MAEPSSDPHIPAEESSSTSPTFIKPASSVPRSFKSKSATREDFVDSAHPRKRPRLGSPLMTAAAAVALAEGQLRAARSTPPPSTGTSPNPPQQALSALMGANHHGTSKAEPHLDVPFDPSATVSEPLAVVADNIQKPGASAADSSGTRDNHALTSPVSLSSVGTVGTLEGMGLSTMTTTVGSPLPIEETVRQVVNASEAGSASPNDINKSGAMSYPNPFLQPTLLESGRRGMSLPHSGTRQGTKSPSSKKHRCPYCATEFTRHHNLKSHLLTHSQEKPYVCSTCSSRFRRLHDLKRHTKLHTGERPHICPKCGRKFARGDALARHNKGPGGCAGRRASMGSFGDGDDGDGDESMEGIVYDEPHNMDDDDGSERRPTPSIRRQAPSGDDTAEDSEHNSRLPSTYPPIQGRPPGGIAGGGYFGPGSGYNQSRSGPSNASPSIGGAMSLAPMAGSVSSSRSGMAASIFAHNPMTESPKPLSPGQAQRIGGPGDSRNRSPSTSFYPQPHPRNTGSGSSLNVPPGAPQLPPPHGLNPPDSRYTLASQGGVAHPPTQPSGPPTHMSGSGPLSSNSNSLSSHGHSGHGSGEPSNPMFAHSDRIWAYVTNLEQRINTMQEEINSLKHQLATVTQHPQRM